MKRSQHLFVIGVLFFITGIVLLFLSNGEIGTSTFFIFPFFFVSTSDVFAIVLFLIFTFFVFVIMMRSVGVYFNQVEPFSDHESMKEYIPVGSNCDVCSAPLPIDAVFCSSCGNPVGYDRVADQ
ncbi:hypothetical protein EU528_09320 [Candidatus Thorarchaeota archaeon]|nr:MAG: hypothetical protein EU528_09320 [Candidatus Thorarchaeota archaeon]